MRNKSFYTLHFVRFIGHSGLNDVVGKARSKSCAPHTIISGFQVCYVDKQMLYLKLVISQKHHEAFAEEFLGSLGQLPVCTYNALVISAYVVCGKILCQALFRPKERPCCLLCIVGSCFQWPLHTSKNRI